MIPKLQQRSFKVAMESYNTHKVGLINADGYEPPLYALNVNFALHNESINRIYYGTVSGDVLNVTDTNILRNYMQAVGNSNRQNLRNSLESYKCYFHIDVVSKFRLDFRSFKQNGKYIVVCFIWKNTSFMNDEKIIEKHVSPSSTYYIDPEHSSILYDIYKEKGL
jgi:hypothetical protein